MYQFREKTMKITQERLEWALLETFIPLKRGATFKKPEYIAPSFKLSDSTEFNTVD